MAKKVATTQKRREMFKASELLWREGAVDVILACQKCYGEGDLPHPITQLCGMAADLRACGDMDRFLTPAGKVAIEGSPPKGGPPEEGFPRIRCSDCGGTGEVVKREPLHKLLQSYEERHE